MPDNNGTQKTILLVDDDEIHLLMAESLLETEYKIYKATSGKETLEFLGKSHVIPDIVLLDIIMLEMNGWEVFKRIKEITELQNVPIVFLTSVDEEGEKRKAFKLGAAEYITKPYDIVELKETIERIIHGNGER